MYWVIDTTYIDENSLLDNLVQENDTTKQKYINRAEAMLFSYIWLSQFYDEDLEVYEFPEDLKMWTLYLVEYLYLNWWIIKQAMKSEKIWDYSYSADTQAQGINDIDIPQNIKLIFRKYKQYWSFIDINIRPNA